MGVRVIKNHVQVATADGTPTLYSAIYDECYHSTKDGALSESLHKHVVPAWTLLPPKVEVVVLDICFGLGYNTLCTLLHLSTIGFEGRVHIIAPELDRDLVASLPRFAYPDALRPFAHVIDQVAQAGWYRDDRCSIDVVFEDARAVVRRLSRPVDLCYQDAFSPKKNPLLWTKEYFADLKAVASDDFILTTYSSATPVRMGLYENGFLLYVPPENRLRSGTIASCNWLPLKPIDMELKKARNPLAKSLHDKEVENG